jgi:hypothetical protein
MSILLRRLLIKVYILKSSSSLVFAIKLKIKTDFYGRHVFL